MQQKKSWQVLPLALFTFFLCTACLEGAGQAVDKRQTTLSLLEALFDDGDTSGIEEFFGEPYIQHNPGLPDGRDALRGLVESLDSENTSHTAHRVAAQGDLVAVQSHVTFGASDLGMAVIDIFRFENEKIVEHWDVVQPVATESQNGHGMFDGEGSNIESPAGSENADANIELVSRLYSEVFNAAELEKLEELVAQDYVQHSPDFADGREGLRNGLAFFQGMFPGLHIEPIRFVAEGDLVFAHVHITFAESDRGDRGKGSAGIDVFRVKDGKLVEHWDVLQDAVADTVSGNTMF